MGVSERVEAALVELTQAIGSLDDEKPGTLDTWSPVLILLERAIDGENVRTYGPRDGHDKSWVVIEVPS